MRMMVPRPVRVRRRIWADSFRRPWWSLIRTAVLWGPKCLPPPMAINCSWTSWGSRRMSVSLHPQRSSRYVALSRSPGGPAGSAARRETHSLWELLRSSMNPVLLISLSHSRAPSSTERRTAYRASGADSGRTRRCGIRRPLYVLFWLAGLSARLPLLHLIVRLNVHCHGKEVCPLADITTVIGKRAIESPLHNHRKG